MDIIQIEISRHNWAGMWCGCERTAEHIPSDLLSVLAASSSDPVDEDWLEGHAFIQSNLMPPAPAATSIIMAAVASGARLDLRNQFMKLLLTMGDGEQDDIAEECLRVIRGGAWFLYEEITSGRSKVAAAYAFRTLRLLDEEAGKLSVYKNAARENLPPHLW